MLCKLFHLLGFEEFSVKKLVHKASIIVRSCTLSNSIHVSHFCNPCMVLFLCVNVSYQIQMLHSLLS